MLPLSPDRPYASSCNFICVSSREVPAGGDFVAGDEAGCDTDPVRNGVAVSPAPHDRPASVPKRDPGLLRELPRRGSCREPDLHLERFVARTTRDFPSEQGVVADDVDPELVERVPELVLQSTLDRVP